MPVSLTLLTRFWLMFLWETQTQGNFLLSFLWLFLAELQFTRDSYKKCNTLVWACLTQNFTNHWVICEYCYFFISPMLTHQDNFIQPQLNRKSSNWCSVCTGQKDCARVQWPKHYSVLLPIVKDCGSAVYLSQLYVKLQTVPWFQNPAIST